MTARSEGDTPPTPMRRAETHTAITPLHDRTCGDPSRRRGRGSTHSSEHLVDPILGLCTTLAGPLSVACR